MESPVIHPESPMEQEDIPFPCMGCGEVGTLVKSCYEELELTWCRFWKKAKLSSCVSIPFVTFVLSCEPR